MEFSKCIALNSLVKEKGARKSSIFDAVSVKFSMYSLGHWSAEIEFQELMYSYEVGTFVAWALSHCISFVIFAHGDRLYLSVQ